MTNQDLNPSGRKADVEQMKQIKQAVAHLPRRERREVRMREFNRAGIFDSDVYRSALIYVGLLGAVALFLGTDRALTYLRAKMRVLSSWA